MCRKPSFTWWDELGRCVIYPVSVHVSGRQWDEKNIIRNKMDDMSYDYNIPFF